MREENILIFALLFRKKVVDREWIEGDRVGASLLETLNKKRLKRIHNSNSLFHVS